MNYEILCVTHHKCTIWDEKRLKKQFEIIFFSLSMNGWYACTTIVHLYYYYSGRMTDEMRSGDRQQQLLRSPTTLPISYWLFLTHQVLFEIYFSNVKGVDFEEQSRECKAKKLNSIIFEYSIEQNSKL